MTGDGAAKRSLEEALVLLNGTEFQRREGVAALRALAREHPGSRAADEAMLVLDRQQEPYRPPPPHHADLRRRWGTVRGLGHPGLPQLVHDLFGSGDGDGALSLLRREVADRVGAWLDAETAELNGGAPPPPRDRLLPPPSADRSAALLAAAVRRWQAAVAVHRTNQLEAALRVAETACDGVGAARVLSQIGDLPPEAGAPMRARAEAIRDLRSLRDAQYTACEAPPDGRWDRETARAVALRQVTAWCTAGLPPADRSRAAAAIAAAQAHQRAFLYTAAEACRGPDALADLHTRTKSIGADHHDAEAFGPALRHWAEELSAAVDSAATPETLNRLAGSLARWQDRLPAPVAAWLDKRRNELERYAALWHNAAAEADGLPSEPVLPLPPPLRARFEDRMRLRAEARRLHASLTDGGDAELEPLFRRATALAHGAHDDPEIAAVAQDIGRRLLRLRLHAALSGGDAAPARAIAEELAAGDAAAYRTLLDRWSAIETLAGAAVAAGDADPAAAIQRWRAAAAAVADLPTDLPMDLSDADAVVSGLCKAAMNALDVQLAASCPAPAAEAALLRQMRDAAGYSLSDDDDARLRTLETVIHRRALDTALRNGQIDAADTALDALIRVAPADAGAVRGRLHLAFLRALGAGPDALLALLSDHWSAFAADPPDGLAEALAAAAEHAAARGGIAAQRAAALVGPGAAFAATNRPAAERLEQLHVWYTLADALTKGKPEAPALLVRFLRCPVPEPLIVALEAVPKASDGRADPVVAALLHHAGRHLHRPPAAGPDPLLLLSARSHALATEAGQAITGTGPLTAERLADLQDRVRAERRVWGAMAYHFSCLPFSVPPAVPPPELDDADRRLSGAVTLLEEIGRAADTDVRQPDALRRCELLREQIVADTPAGALRTMLLDRADGLGRAAAVPAGWIDWQVAAAAVSRTSASGVFAAAAAALDRLAATIAAAGLQGRTVDDLATRDAARSIAALGPALEPSTIGLDLGGLAELLRALEHDEARVRSAVHSIRATAPRIPVGGRLNATDPDNARLLDLFVMAAPRSHRALAVVHALIGDQDFDFLRRVEPRRFPAWLADILRDHDDA